MDMHKANICETTSQMRNSKHACWQVSIMCRSTNDLGFAGRDLFLDLAKGCLLATMAKGCFFVVVVAISSRYIWPILIGKLQHFDISSFPENNPLKVLEDTKHHVFAVLPPCLPDKTKTFRSHCAACPTCSARWEIRKLSPPQQWYLSASYLQLLPTLIWLWV